MLLSPLEQFEVNALLSLAFPASNPGEMSVFVLLSNLNLFTLVVFLIITTIMRYISLYSYVVPSAPAQLLSEGAVSFVAGLVGENTAAKHKILHVFVPYVFVVFSFILVSNFAGMVPYSFTVTSSLAVTFAIAAASFIGVNIVGARIHKLGFLAIFLPPDAPYLYHPL